MQDAADIMQIVEKLERASEGIQQAKGDKRGPAATEFYKVASAATILALCQAYRKQREFNVSSCCVEDDSPCGPYASLQDEAAKLRAALADISTMSLGVSGMSFQQANDWFNERARSALTGAQP